MSGSYSVITPRPSMLEPWDLSQNCVVTVFLSLARLPPSPDRIAATLAWMFAG